MQPEFPPEISVVCPCYNEEENVDGIAAAIIAELERVHATFELIFIDNASADRTVAHIKALCARDPRVKLIANLRNFGQMRSPTYGIYQATGRAVLGIAADFQDPPSLIGPLVTKWREGWPIVLGTRAKEESTGFHKLVRRVGYWFFNRYGDVPVIPGATGFGIYDRRVVDELKSWHEPEPFYRALLVESGFPITTLPHERPRRLRGKTSNTLLPLIDFAISAVSGSAKKLLRLPIFLGLLTGVLAGVSLLAGIVIAITGGPYAQFLWAALAGVNFAVIMVSVGLVGDQVRLISERTRRTPLVIEKERVNF